MTEFLDKLLQTKSMVICCGSGGVGKTTIAAVLALRGAMLGKRALVLTIDPAKRLANSLGLESLGNKIRKIEPRHLDRAGLHLNGELYAMMLDCKRTFDELIRKYASSEEACQKILNNRYYEHVSDAMTGSHEYMAMEKLYELHQEKKFDLIILDTPPTQNALDFLDAPNRVTNFLDDSVLKWFLKPYFIAGKISLKTVGIGGKLFLKILEKITGIEVLHDVSEFFHSFSGMFEGFKERAERVRELLKKDQTSFLLVTSPHSLTISECIFFHQKLSEYQMPFGGILVNKMHEDFGVSLETPPEDLIKQTQTYFQNTSHEMVEKLAKNAGDYQVLFEHDQKALSYLKKQTQLTNDCIRTIRYFDEDIFALKDLKRMLEEIFPKKAVGDSLPLFATHA